MSTSRVLLAETEPMEHALVLEGVTKRFGKFTAVDNLSLKIPKGSIYGFIGPNGAGKTTTIRMVMSIFYPDQGKITVLGHPNAEEIKDRLGYLPEEKGLYKKMRAGEIVAYFGRLKGLDGPTAKKKAHDLLERFGLGEWIDKKCEALSKGMGQKVQVLASIAHDPDLVILDEPFSGLDPVRRISRPIRDAPRTSCSRGSGRPRPRNERRSALPSPKSPTSTPIGSRSSSGTSRP